MKQRILIGIFIIIMYFIFLIPNQSIGATSSSDYTIQSYNINMIVNEDNTFDITENITAYFNVPRHGIYRKIPLKNSVTRADKTQSNNRAKITNISVNRTYTTSTEYDYKVIKIGDANQTLTGEQNYTIKYKYDIGKDPLKDADELYFNLIGNEWDTSISNVSFTIIMPKPFDESLLGFSSGDVGSTSSSNITYSVNGNVITGNTIDPLNAGQALTVRLTLPEGYFVVDNSDVIVYSDIVIAICVIFVLIACGLWIVYGKDDKVIETVEFYPPDGYNSAEVQFLYDGKVDEEGIISLLIYLANQGYLKIEETEEKEKIFKSKSFRITKLKEYTGDDEYEKIFFNGLFEGTELTRNVNMNRALKIMKDAKKQGKKTDFMDALELSEKNYDEKDSVTALDLYDNFYITVNKIKLLMNSKENEKKIFETTVSGKGKYLKLMIIVIFILITLKPVMEEYEDIGTFTIALLFPRNSLYCNNRKSNRYNRNTWIICYIMGSIVWRNSMANYCITSTKSRCNVFRDLFYWNN